MEILKEINIAIVEDDIYFAEAQKKYIENQLTTSDSNLDFNISIYSSAIDFLENISQDLDVVLLDYYLEDDSGEIPFPGLVMLKTIKDYCYDCKVVVVSGQNDQKVTIELFNNGIYEYIVKDNDTFLRVSSTLRKAVREKILNHYI